MAYAPRPTTVFPGSTNTTSSLRQASLGASHPQQSSALATRIAAKRQELENLKQLRDLSGALATQMSALEEKLSALRDGTEAVACILANWDNVLRAISMASTKVLQPAAELPVTLVRIPVQPPNNEDTKENNSKTS